MDERETIHETLGWWHSQASMALEWIGDNLACQGIRRPETIIQRNVGEESVVLSVPLSHRWIYFKASHPLNSSEGGRGVGESLNEAVITEELSTNFPQFLPSVVAVERERNWLLTYDAGPSARVVPPTGEQVRAAFRSLADLHLTAWGMGDFWVKAGWPVWDSSESPSMLRLLLERSALWNHLPRSWYHRTAGAIDLVCFSCDRLEACSIPWTLLHADLHAGNVCFPQGQRGHPIFLDWATTCIAHPFLDVLLFAARMQRYASRPTDVSAWIEAYLQPWYALFSVQKVQRCMAHCALVLCVFQLWMYRNLTEAKEPWQQRMRDGFRFWVYTFLERCSFFLVNEKEPSFQTVFLG